MITKFKYGWRPDLPDHRDMKYEHHLPMMTRFPTQLDRRPWQSPIKNQLSVGSCVSFGTVAALEELELWELRAGLSLNQAPEEFDLGQFDQISELFIYANGRKIEGVPISEDSGLQVRDGVKACQVYGICREKAFPYSEANAFVPPPPSAYDEAKAHTKIYGYRLDNTNMNSLQSCLLSGSGIIFGMSVYESFESSSTMQTGIVPYPDSSEQLLGGHCMYIVGWKVINGMIHFIVKNSWGTQVGDQGYLYIPESIITNADMASDFWTLRRVKSNVAGVPLAA